MRILQIVTSIDAGGVSTFLYNYYKNMNRESIHFEIVAIEKIGKQKFHDSLIELGAVIHYMPKNYLKRIIFLIKFLANNKYDIAHSHIELASAIYLFIAKLFGIKVRIAHAHMAFLEYDSISEKILRHVLNKISTHKWGCSKEAVIGLFGKQYSEVAKIIHNAIDISKYSYTDTQRKIYRDMFSLNEKFVVGFVGRFTYQKNIFYMLDVFFEVQKIKENAVLMLVGTGELHCEFKKKAEELGVQNKILYLGVRDDVNFLMMAMDVLILPSRWEGLGIVLIEAQAAALKCIASDKVPLSTNISKYIHFQPISLPPKQWANTISKACVHYERKNIDQLLISNHYDIHQESKHLTSMYLNTVS